MTDSTLSPSEIDETLATWKLHVRPESGLFCPAQVTATSGCVDRVFQLRGGTWRLAFVRNYGNLTGVSGAGCDASGQVLTDGLVIRRLDAVVADAAVAVDR